MQAWWKQVGAKNWWSPNINVSLQLLWPFYEGDFSQKLLQDTGPLEKYSIKFGNNDRGSRPELKGWYIFCCLYIKYISILCTVLISSSPMLTLCRHPCFLDWKVLSQLPFLQKSLVISVTLQPCCFPSPWQAWPLKFLSAQTTFAHTPFCSYLISSPSSFRDAIIHLCQHTEHAAVDI